MKKLNHVFLTCLLALITFTACEKLPVYPGHPGGDNGDNDPNTCIDPTAIRTDLACMMIYDPVCGCNGITYGNSCEADIAGVLSWTEGPCEKDKNNVCIDEEKIIPQGECYCLMYTVYQPVCGCNDITYNSSCEAECAGVQSYTDGPCKQ